MNQNDFVCELNECKLYLENSIILPCCGSTICGKHENYFEKKDEGKFKCPICKKQQPIAQYGFSIPTNIINSTKNEDHLGEMHKNLSNSIPKYSESKIKEPKLINSEDIIAFSKLSITNLFVLVVY
jgi:hypothetical protein